jgi:mannose-6-phosphate isomerase-like protein (cupin superfamily)
MCAANTSRRVLGPTEGDSVRLGGLGVRHMIDAARSGGSFALVEHPLAARSLGSPVHTHSREDEYTYVLEGTIGVQIGDEVIEASTGDLVFKPRDIPHAFWNATDEPARLLELISPAGFERYFDEVAALFPPDGPPDTDGLAAAFERYGLDMRPETVGPLMERYGLRAA